MYPWKVRSLFVFISDQIPRSPKFNRSKFSGSSIFRSKPNQMTKCSRDLENKFPPKFDAITTDTDCSLDKVMAVVCLYESWTRKKKKKGIIQRFNGQKRLRHRARGCVTTRRRRHTKRSGCTIYRRQ